MCKYVKCLCGPNASPCIKEEIYLLEINDPIYKWELAKILNWKIEYNLLNRKKTITGMKNFSEVKMNHKRLLEKEIGKCFIGELSYDQDQYG